MVFFFPPYYHLPKVYIIAGKFTKLKQYNFIEHHQIVIKHIISVNFK